MTKKKILIIEDNEQNLYLTTFLLEKEDYEVVQARDGQQGLELAVSENPDLILLDIQLPVMDGYEVARRLKQAEETKAIPVVAVTSYAMAGDRETILAAGCEGYIEKPIDPDSFVERVRRFLSQI
ncbi:MAG: response regulator [Deltaproteobacteria bacterium]|nr:response regulator [Deltaproteobacteria bacterium]